MVWDILCHVSILIQLLEVLLIVLLPKKKKKKTQQEGYVRMVCDGGEVHSNLKTYLKVISSVEE